MFDFRQRAMAKLLISCDIDYYNTWAVNLVRSMKRFVPWIDIHIIIVNADNIEKIDSVTYHFDYQKFSDTENAIAYYQAVRFLKCSEIFPNKELVMTIDCDSLCTESFSKEDFEKICSSVSVLRHHKTERWLAGLVTFGDSNEFRKAFTDRLLEKPIEKWFPGYDQKILRSLEKEYNFVESVPGDWIGFGYKKGKFITLKGEQKTASKYISIYKKELFKVI